MHCNGLESSGYVTVKYPDVHCVEHSIAEVTGRNCWRLATWINCKFSNVEHSISVRPGTGLSRATQVGVDVSDAKVLDEIEYDKVVVGKLNDEVSVLAIVD